MLKTTMATVGGVRVVAMDSISYIDATDRDAVVVSASHGGTSSGEYATRHPAVMVIFNDAGVGKDQAGTQALTMLDALNVPAATVAHTSARIGDASDTWHNGRLSFVNRAAQDAGVEPGMTVDEAVRAKTTPAP